MKLPVVSGKETIKALQKDGFSFVSQKGSHVKLQKSHPGGKTIIIVPDHKVLKRGTLSGILRRARITPADFRKLLKR